MFGFDPAFGTKLDVIAFIFIVTCAISPGLKDLLRTEPRQHGVAVGLLRAMRQ